MFEARLLPKMPWDLETMKPAKRQAGPLSQGRDSGLPGRLLFSPVPWLVLREGKFEVSRGLASPMRRPFAERS